jgi:hypothetical protein
METMMPVVVELKLFILKEVKKSLQHLLLCNMAEQLM